MGRRLRASNGHRLPHGTRGLQEAARHSTSQGAATRGGAILEHGGESAFGRALVGASPAWEAAIDDSNSLVASRVRGIALALLNALIAVVSARAAQKVQTNGWPQQDQSASHTCAQAERLGLCTVCKSVRPGFVHTGAPIVGTVCVVGRKVPLGILSRRLSCVDARRDGCSREPPPRVEPIPRPLHVLPQRLYPILLQQRAHRRLAVGRAEQKVRRPLLIDDNARMLSYQLAHIGNIVVPVYCCCLLYTSPSPRDGLLSRMPSSA